MLELFRMYGFKEPDGKFSGDEYIVFVKRIYDFKRHYLFKLVYVIKDGKKYLVRFDINDGKEYSINSNFIEVKLLRYEIMEEYYELAYEILESIGINEFISKYLGLCKEINYSYDMILI